MENILRDELIKNARDVHKHTVSLGPSYNEAMGRALETFKGMGLPSKNDEDWIYTNIAKNLAPRFFTNPSEIVHDIPSTVIDRRGMIILNNGVFNRFQSVLPEGITIDQQRPSESFFDAFDALNFSTALSPLFLKVAKNTMLDFPLTIVHLNDEIAVNKIVSPRIHIEAFEFSKTSIVEVFTSTQNDLLQYTTNSATFFNLRENASLLHVKVQREAFLATHIGLTKASVAKSAVLKSFTVDLGCITARHNIEVHLESAGSEGEVHGLYALKKSEHADVFSKIFHQAPHTRSDQLFKGILGGTSHGAFTGKIEVAKDAQLINSNQLNNNLILSKKAHVSTRPQLLVAADDVKCSHGATIGQLSSEEEFYLESRGIHKNMAKQMLSSGFAAEVLFKIEDKKIVDFTLKLLNETLANILADETHP